MAKKGSVGVKSSAASTAKNKVAPQSLNDKVAILLQLASSSPKQSFQELKTEAKLFELVVLAEILQTYKKHAGKGSVLLQNHNFGVLKLGGGPCSANKSVFSYFELYDRPGHVRYEAWVSVEVTTLSYERAGGGLPIPIAGMHEIDIAIFDRLPLNVKYPSYRRLCAGFSCKHFWPQKEAVREALGIRRETALLSEANESKVPWLVSKVPARPASPLFLVSSNSGLRGQYGHPVQDLGVYMMSIPF